MRRAGWSDDGGLRVALVCERAMSGPMRGMKASASRPSLVIMRYIELNVGCVNWVELWRKQQTNTLPALSRDQGPGGGIP